MTTIITKNSSTAGAAPTAGALVQGELAVNVTDRRIFTGNASGIVVELGTPSIDDNGNATAITIDSSENVGIGAASPAAKLDVAGNLLFSAASPQMQFNAGGPIVRSPSANTLAFLSDSSTERMRIDSSGNLLVNGTSITGSGVLKVKANAENYCYSSFGTANYTAMQMVFNASQVGTITCTSTLTSYNVTSDYRLKENIVPLTGSLSKLAQLKPSTYNYKADPETIIEGFIAHELQSVVPHAVTGEKDAVGADGKPIYQGVDASFLIPHLVAAVQELKAIVDTQAARITTLENK